MPRAFERCVRSSGSRVRTIKPNEDQYLRVCYDRDNQAHADYVKTRKSAQRRTVINPITGRRIKRGGRTHRELVQDGVLRR